MHQLSKIASIGYHLYPGVLITVFFVFAAPFLAQRGYPPQLAILLAIAVVAVPVFLLHLRAAQRQEGAFRPGDLLGFRKTLPTRRAVLYALGLVVLSFLLFGLTQPLAVFLNERVLAWLPTWYTVQDFKGYSPESIRLVLVLNLLLNGLVAPVLEELYFRAYLLPRMKTWGGAAPFVGAVLFSLYHFWQPALYPTLVLAMFPLAYVVWKTQNYRLGIYVHATLNLLGAIATFGAVQP